MIPVVPIKIKYSCFKCGIDRREIEVPSRGEEDVIVWMDQAAGHVARDHRDRSPQCDSEVISELLIPHQRSDQRVGSIRPQ